MWINKQHHELISRHALGLMPGDSLLAKLLGAELAALEFGSYAPDTVAFWADHIACANPYDASDPTRGHAVDLLVGAIDLLATLVLPFDLFPAASAAFLAGCISHVAADLNQPYHVAGRHGEDHEEHRAFERAMQDWALAHAAAPDIPTVSLPGQMRDYLEMVALPRSYGRYRVLAGTPGTWQGWFAVVHASAVHDVLVAWQVAEREIARRKLVQERVSKLAGDTEPLDDRPGR